jgi:membrane protein required for colicin V production
MILDIIVCILFLWALFKGLRNGLIVALFSFLAFIVGLAAAVKLSAVAAEYIGQAVNISDRWLPVLAFIAVFAVVVLLVRLGAKAVEKVVQVAMLGWLNRLGGVLLYFFLYLFVFSVLLFYANGLGLIRPETVAASATYPYIAPIGPAVIGVLGVVLPFLKTMFTELQDFFGRMAE